MSLGVAAVVLFSALLHASWNAILRVEADRVATITLLATFAAVFALPGLFLVPPPAAAAWPWLAASVALHIGYNVLLANAYTHGELGKVYPIARGTAPLLILLASLLVLREPLASTAVIGIGVLGSGILLLALDRGVRILREAPRGVAFALATSVFVAAYSIADGMGARAAGDPHSYTLWLFVLDGLPLLLWAFLRRGRAAGVVLTRNWRAGAVAGLLSLAAYWIVIWAMTRAPIALVAAMRETSVVMALAIGIVWLGEPLSWPRAIYALTVLTGLVLTRL